MSSVLRQEREPVGVLTDDFIRKFSKFANRNCLSKYYGLTAPINMIRAYHHKFKWSTVLSKFSSVNLAIPMTIIGAETETIID